MTRPAAGAGRIAALVYNPIKVDSHRLRTLVRAHARAAGWAAPLFFETTPDDLGQGPTRQALAAGAAVVLVAGGDGTVRAVSEAIADSGVPLAIVPSGTGNLLARNLALPLSDPETMIHAAFQGRTVGLDIGIAEITRADGGREEHAFVVMAGIGLDAKMIENTNPQLKKTVGWVAYVDGAARSLATATPFRVTYRRDGGGRTHTSKVQSVLFANCGALPAGIALIPEASIADGLLDACVFQPTGWFGWLGVWRKIWWDNSVLRRFRAGRRVLERRRDQSVHYLQGAGFTLTTTPEQPIELDGDGFGRAVGLRCRVSPAALVAIVPADLDVAAL